MIELKICWFVLSFFITTRDWTFAKKSISISSNFYYFILRDLLIHFRHHRSQTSFLVKVVFVFSWNEHNFLYNKTIENVLCSFLVNQILILFLVKITFYKAKVWKKDRRTLVGTRLIISQIYAAKILRKWTNTSAY